jgi:phosphoribosylamine--glycine ligase
VDAGHKVQWFVKPKPGNSKLLGANFRGIEKVDNFVAASKWADLVVPTSNDDYLPRLDKLRQNGVLVFGPTQESAKLEISRGDGLKLLEKYGIESAPYEVFKTMKEAYNHVRKTEDRYVFKTLGDNEDKALTYVSKHPADMLQWMESRMKDTNIKGDVMLQAFVEGIEMGVSCFVGSKGFVGQWNESFEHKKLMSGNYGPNTGEQGTVAYFTTASKLADTTLKRLESAIVDRGHFGDVALGFMIDKQGIPRPNEWTCRLGWPIFNMMLGSIKGDPVEWMYDAMMGKDTTSFKEDIGTCVVLTTPPFPNDPDDPKKLEGTPIYGVTPGNRKHLHPQGVKLDVMYDMEDGKVTQKPMWNTAGCYNIVVTGFGENVKQSSTRAYKTVKQLHISNMIVRDDIGEKLKETLPLLHKQGFAEHCEYGD